MNRCKHIKRQLKFVNIHLKIMKVKNISEIDRYKRNYIKLEVPSHYSWQDYYAIVVVALLLPFSIIIFFTTLFLIPILINFSIIYRILRLHFPALSIVERDFYFYGYNTVVFIFSIPLLLLTSVWVIFVYIVNFLFTIPVCGLGKGFEKSIEGLQPLSKTPGAFDDDAQASSVSRKHGYLWSFGDLFIAVLGTMCREGYWEFIPSVPCMIAFIPVIKYVVMSNPRLYENIEEVFINQWTEPLDANGDFIVNGEDYRLAQQNLLEAFCHPMVSKKNKRVLDRWPFLGFHQLPPPHRESKTVAGMQFMEYRSRYFFHPRVTLLSHTTVPLNRWNLMNIPGYRPRSSTAEWTLLQVRLLSWNPFYILR